MLSEDKTTEDALANKMGVYSGKLYLISEKISF